MQITPPALGFLFNEFSSLYQKGFTNYKPRWQEIAERVPSSTKLNTYGWMGDLPGFREWIGPRVFHNIAARAYTLVNKSWEDSFTISRDDIEDDNFGIYNKASTLLGKNAARLWDDLVFDALRLGVSSLCYDGQYFFDTDHPVNIDDDSAGTYSNLITATPPTPAAIGTLIATMMGFKNDAGVSRELYPDTLYSPPELAQAIFTAVQAQVIASNNAAIPNPVANNAITGRTINVVVVPRLSIEPTVYYLAATGDMKPIVLQVRREAEFTARTAPDMDNVFYRKEYEYGADARGVAGYGLPFTILRVVTV